MILHFVPHISPTLVSHSGCSGPHGFTLVSHTCLPLGVFWAAWFSTCLPLVSHHPRCSGPHESTFASHLCLPLWVLWAAWFYMCLPLVSLAASSPSSRLTQNVLSLHLWQLPIGLFYICLGPMLVEFLIHLCETMQVLFLRSFGTATNEDAHLISERYAVRPPFFHVFWNTVLLNP